MATKRPDYTWKNGYREQAPASSRHKAENDAENGSQDDYIAPPSVELVTSNSHNELGINVVRDWPTIFDGKPEYHSWWEPQDKVDVLICGAGPSGLGLATSLARQGVTFRIIDKADGPLVVGRADGVQPRFLETIAKWGLSLEVADEGPLINATAMYKDGERLLYTSSHQSDSRYRGLHVITQGQIERIYIRDLLRHKAIVERNCSLHDFTGTSADGNEEYPVRANIHNERTGQRRVVQAKFLVGCDGGSSVVRKTLKIPFDGVSTDIYWGIMDCVFKTDYPHAWVFGMVMSSEHGCCAIIPREDGYIRLYTQLDISHTGPISASRQAKDPNFVETGGKVEVHSITPEEVLEQANKIFAPFKLEFASTLSWFAIWKISERVARTYSSANMRVHLAGDAAHVHSVLGAFGLNASILDVANLSWKIGLAAKGLGNIDTLLPTYSSERRKHAVKIIQVSGEYLRFICGSSLSVPDLSHPEAMDKIDGQSQVRDMVDSGRRAVEESKPDEGDRQNMKEKDLAFIGKFFAANGHFLLGVDCPYDDSVIVPGLSPPEKAELPMRCPALAIRHGVRAPNPRVCFSNNETGYLYDKLIGAGLFHIILFASSLNGSELRRQIRHFTDSMADRSGFYQRFGGARVFQVVIIVKLLPFEFESLLTTDSQRLGSLLALDNVVVVYDDRAPDEDAHYTYGVDHKTGAIAVVRPDLWVGMTCYPDESERIETYVAKFLHRV